MGNVLHRLGDVSAQVFLTPYWSAKYHLPEMDVLTGFYDDHHGGESEAFFEGGPDIVRGDLNLYVQLARHFLLRAAGNPALTVDWGRWPGGFWTA